MHEESLIVYHELELGAVDDRYLVAGRRGRL